MKLSLLWVSVLAVALAACGSKQPEVEPPPPMPVDQVNATPTEAPTDPAMMGDATCPHIQPYGPSDAVKAGSPIVFSAAVHGGDAAVAPTFNWSVSAGSIASGQGTSEIQVSSDGLAGQTVTATIDVGGFAPSCATTASFSAQIQ